MSRPDWDDYFLGIAAAVARRGDCTRRQVGAVIVRDRRIVSCGYNGSPAGRPGCLSDGACPRGQHYPQMTEPRYCVCGLALPCPYSLTPGTSYDTCVAVHAEANAIIYADHAKCVGASIYVTSEPCTGCLQLIDGAGIDRILVAEESR